MAIPLTPAEISALATEIRNLTGLDPSAMFNSLSSAAAETQENIIRLTNSFKEQIETIKIQQEITEMLYKDRADKAYVIGDNEIKMLKAKIEKEEEYIRQLFHEGHIQEDRYNERLKELKLEDDIAKARERGRETAKKHLEDIGFKSADKTKFGFLFAPSTEGVAQVKEYAKLIGDLANPTNLFANALELVYKNSIEMFKNMDKSAVAFNRATGFAGEFNDVVMDSTFNLRGFGITADQAAGELVSGFMEFTELSKEIQTDLVESTALLNAQGFASAKQAQNLQFLAMSFGATAIEGQNFNVALDDMAQKMKIPIGKMTDDFKTAQPVLAALGGSIRNAGEEFQRLEAISKGTGLSMSKILDITGKFDTFDGAAQSVGRLNAMLGGPYLSTLEMVETTDPSKRFELMSRAVRDAAGSFDSLSYYQKKALASSMGLSDVTELAAVLQGRTDLIEDPMASLSAEEIIKKKEEMKEFQETMDIFKGVAMELAVSLKPFLIIIKDIASLLRGFLEIGDGMVGKVVGYGIAFLGLSKALGFIDAAMMALNMTLYRTAVFFAPIILGFLLVYQYGPKTAAAVGLVSLAVAGLAFYLGMSAVFLASLTFGLTALAGAAAAAAIGFDGMSESSINLNHTMDLPQSRSLTKDVLPDLTSGLEGIEEVSTRLPVSVEKTSKSMIKVNHEMDTFKVSGQDTAKTLTEINSNTQKTMMSSVANTISNSQAPINTKIELTLDGKKVAETVHNYKVPENSNAGKSVRKMAIPPGELI